MKTTEVIVEFVIAGILVLISLLLLVEVCDPNSVSQFLTPIGDKIASPLLHQALLLAVLLSVSYGLGIFTEFVGRITFEYWSHNKTKKKRLAKYIQKCGSKVLGTPILCRFREASDEQADDSKRPQQSHLSKARNSRTKRARNMRSKMWTSVSMEQCGSTCL
jgi:hypothetical protein